MTVNEIIEKIQKAETCGDIFEKDASRIKQQFRDFAKCIHPDVCSDVRAKETFIKLNKLYETALDHIFTGSWEETGVLQLTPKIMMAGIKNISTFELGARYVSDTKIAYIFDSGKEAYFSNYTTKLTQTARFKDSKIRNMYQDKIPTIKTITDMSYGRKAIVVGKTPDDYPMDLFLKTYGNKLTGRDIAWMISRMCDLLCFLYINSSMVLNGFTKENLLICPKTHKISIFGGWWYASLNGTSMIGTNKTVYNCMSSLTRTNKIATPQTDIESMRHICSEMVHEKTDIPKSILNWINSGSSDDPLQTYHDWNEALDKAYGQRRFVKFDVDSDKIYGK